MLRAFISAVAMSTLLAACQPAPPPANAPTPASSSGADAGPPLTMQTQGWQVSEKPVWTLEYVTGDQGTSVACPEQKKQLKISFFPAWELAGPFDTAVMTIGDKSFDVVADSATPKDGPDASRPVYVLEANADTISAIMLGDTITLKLKDGSQERVGPKDASGAFDMFATTCAQINGLR